MSAHHALHALPRGDGVERVGFVKLKIPITSDWIGQTVSMDAFNRIIYSTPAFHPYRSFAKALILAPSTRVHMVKATATGRERVPDDVLRYKRMWQIIIANGQAGDMDPCEVCRQDDGKAIRCPLCTLVFHPECCGMLSRHLGAARSSTSPSPPDLSVMRLGVGICPDALRTSFSLCCLCQRIV